MLRKGGGGVGGKACNFHILHYICAPERRKTMLIIPVKEGESIDKALKKFKKKFERTGTMRQLRKRQSFTKPSVARRKEMIRAAYKLQMQTEQE